MSLSCISVFEIFACACSVRDSIVHIHTLFTWLFSACRNHTARTHPCKERMAPLKRLGRCQTSSYTLQATTNAGPPRPASWTPAQPGITPIVLNSSRQVSQNVNQAKFYTAIQADCAPTDTPAPEPAVLSNKWGSQAISDLEEEDLVDMSSGWSSRSVEWWIGKYYVSMLVLLVVYLSSLFFIHLRQSGCRPS